MRPQLNGAHRRCPESVELDDVLISERGIYAASPFKEIIELKRVETRAPSAKLGHYFKLAVGSGNLSAVSQLRLMNQAVRSLRRMIQRIGTLASRSICPDGSGTGWTATVKVSPVPTKIAPV
jgi:hypothetical protein